MPVEIANSEQDKICHYILTSLPEWFALPSAINNYAKETLKNPVLIYTQDKNPVGLCMLKTHTPIHTEIALIAVLKPFQNKGIGTDLLKTSEKFIKQEQPDTKILSVKTLAPEKNDAFYLKTYEFYKSRGFKDFEKLPTLWEEDNPCLLMTKEII